VKQNVRYRPNRPARCTCGRLICEHEHPEDIARIEGVTWAPACLEKAMRRRMLAEIRAQLKAGKPVTRPSAGPTPDQIGMRLMVDCARFPKAPKHRLEHADRSKARVEVKRPLEYDFGSRSIVGRVLGALFMVRA